MKRKKTIIIALSFIFSCFCFTAIAQTIQNGTNTYAIVIGITAYEDASIPPLNYADKDASLFAQWLQSKPGGSVPSYQVKLLVNQDATVAAVYNALDWVKEKAKSGDVIYIYFSGHGDVETKDNISQGYLLAWNSPPNNYRNNALSVTHLNDVANTLTTKNNAKVVLITDACHSGKMAGDFFKGKQLTAHNLNLVLNNQVRLASCQEDEEAAEGPAWGGGRGVFSYYLLMGLNGKASKNELVRLQDLQTFLNTSFKNDNTLKLENHQQNPVVDGNPIFPLAKIDTAILKMIDKGNPNIKSNTSGLQSLKSIGPQPMDYFFAIAKGSTLDDILPFDSYVKLPVEDVPFKMVTDYIENIKEATLESHSNYIQDSIRSYSFFKNKSNNISLNNSDSAFLNERWKKAFEQKKLEIQNLYRETHDTINNLKILQQQLKNNAYLRKTFTEKFVQVIHQKAQDMINDYLKGDLNELEKRQYYYSGNRNYSSFLPSVNTAIHLVPKSNYLHDILVINQAYLSGVINRLEITTHKTKADSLLNEAFKHELNALKLEPYAAYIHNELGNIYFQKHNYDSASYHFNYASLLSPAWAIPWSNKIRLNLATNNLTKAKEAIYIADSLQKNLAYVNVNAGLVMEKEGNLLAAESYYLNAISQNNIHYLPYERLGKIYILTGEYEKAESFLYQANKRKTDFMVNEVVFNFGIELGGRPDTDEADFILRDCDTKNDSTVAGWGTLYLLTKALFKTYHKETQDEGKNILQKIIQKQPNIILASHYLGKLYFEEGNWQQAEEELKKSIAEYKSPEQYLKYLKETLKDSLLKHIQKENLKFLKTNDINKYVNSACLLSNLAGFRFDELEDHYMLAAIYEKHGFFDEAIQEYKIISGIENIRQMEQATLQDYAELSSKSNKEKNEDDLFSADWGINEKMLIRKYNQTIRMGGSIKAARLYEKDGKYENAEEILLKQVTQNQAAGYSRQSEMNKGNFGPTGRSSLNYYWLDVNKDLEMETYNFYTRMLIKFPRNTYWNKKAGLFLYHRLALTYFQIPVAERSTFYEYSLDKAYPFAGSIEGPNEIISYKEGGFIKIDNQFSLLGTKEVISIDTSTYDPLSRALYFLQQSVKFSGESNPDPVLLEYVADLQSWMDDIDASISNYKYLVKIQPSNATLRNKLIDYLVVYERLPEAREQLDSLYQRKQIRHTQLLKLADYTLLSKKHTDFLKLMTSYIPENKEDENKKLALYVKHYSLVDEPEKALAYLKEMSPPLPVSIDNYYFDYNLLEKEFYNYYYTKSRIYALTGENKDALFTLKYLLDQKFDYKNLINADPAWDKLRTTKTWLTLLQSYPFYDVKDTDEEEHYEESTNTNTLWYRIPILDYRFQY